jgi:creatinine amidohydrolase/Fe(II)-dependent formamide hydrolase-like protein
MMLHLTPELVDMERARRTQGHATFPEPPEHIGLLGPIPFTWTTDDVSSSGAIGDPRPATVERGRDIVELSVAKVALALEEICRFEMPTPSGGTESPAA